MFSQGLFSSYTFWVVALGTGILAMAAGAVGCITVLKGQSLIGDAIGHASFPGIVLAFMLSSQRNPLLLLLGAVASGSVAFLVIQGVHKNGKLALDSVLAIMLSSFFGLGMVLKSFIQGNPDYASASQSGLQNYIFGQAAYIMRGDVFLIFGISLTVLAILVLFYKEFKVFVFDEVYAKTIGISHRLLYALVMISAMSLIAAGLKVVGAILISSLLIVPAITALLWSHNFAKVLIIAAITGGVSAFIGTYLSTAIEGMSTGATIIVVMSVVALFSLLFAPRGLISTYRKRRRALS